MANRYGNLVGSKKISEDFETINVGFDRVQAEIDTKGTPADAQAKADAAKAAAIATAAEALTAHKARGADEHPTAKGNAAGFMSAADKSKSDASTSAATPDTLMQRDTAGRAKVAAPAAADDIARKAETDAVQVNLDSHAADTVKHVTQAEHEKLTGIAAGAEVNQNAFAKVNDVAASSKSDTLQLAGGTGITVTTDPATKRVTFTATGEATPGAHASSHLPGGTDVIPFATETVGGLMAPTDKKDITTLKAAINRVDLTTNLGPGSSVINADQASDLDLTLYGQTRTNLLGDTGNFEVDSNGDGVADGWTGVLNSATATIETTSKYGLKSQRITSKSGDTSPFRRVERTVNLKAGKRYVFMADVVTDGIGACKINAQYSSGTTIESVQSTASKVHFIKLAPTEDTVATVRLYNYTPIGTVAWVQFDGAGVFEVNDDLYNRIGVDITADNIRDYLPHVDGRQHVNGVIVRRLSDSAESQTLILPLTLASTPDGSVRDTAYYRDGAWRKMQRVDISVDPAVALANPVESEIAKAEGAISLHPGGNQITVETGVIQREKVTFNATTKQGTTAKRSARIIGVYKGANPDPYITYSSGGQTLPQLVNAVESGKDYYVTYMALDKYALSANVTQTDAKFVKGLNGAMSDVVRDVARLGQQNSRQDFADTYIQAMAENLRTDVDAHVATTSAHGAVSAPTANRLIVRDANGRAQIGAPNAAADIARLDTVTGQVGALTDLQTTAKGNTVAAINEVFQSGVSAKQGVVDAINAMGGSASTSDSWATLANKIQTINTGKKYATGDVTSSSGATDFTRTDGTTISTGYLTVSGLTFTPTVITVTVKSNSAFALAFTAKTATHTAGPYVYTGTGAAIKVTGTAYINSTGFRLPLTVTLGSVVTWEAFG